MRFRECARDRQIFLERGDYTEAKESMPEVRRISGGDFFVWIFDPSALPHIRIKPIESAHGEPFGNRGRT